MTDKDQAQTLGRIEGKLDIMLQNQRRQDEKLDEMDGRLRKVEVKAAQTGAIAGAVTSVLAALGIEFAKKKLGM
ncbi:hypothetical protein [Ralstonia mannitolilytica]|jgi:hypothetical protein|uniref:hypothetical protein n=1 Tax=Ralstonia mannitolilytica TaxID=105219 RepID=UPI000CEDDD55|nr:hypothetical protein [Ralstonia mannitolilytica]